MTETVRAFLRSGDRDGPSTRLLDGLDPAERAAVERELLGLLGDRVHGLSALAGLRHLRVRAAVEPLRTLMRGKPGLRAVRAAIALWEIAADEEALRMLCRMVAWTSHRVHGRIDAANYLRYAVDRPDALAVLIGALGDRDTVVDAHARLAVADRLGLAAEVDDLRHGRTTVEEVRRAAWRNLPLSRTAARDPDTERSATRHRPR